MIIRYGKSTQDEHEGGIWWFMINKPLDRKNAIRILKSAGYPINPVIISESAHDCTGRLFTGRLEYSANKHRTLIKRHYYYDV